MSYHVVDPADIDPYDRETAEFRSISGSVGLENVGLNVADAGPGEQIPLRYHYHDEQEEAFFVLSGTLHVETPDEEFVVDEGRCFVVEPGNPHRAFNPSDADDRVRVLAIGAPSVDDVHPYDP